MDDYQIIYRGLNMGVSPYCITSIDGLGSPDLRTQEIEISNEDGITFGREFSGARKWTIAGSVKTGSTSRASVGTEVDDAWDYMSALLTTWDSPDVRRNVRDVSYLTFKRPGRDPVLVYGRPERIDPDLSGSWRGHITYTALFRQADPHFYSEAEEVVTNQLLVPYSGGLLYTDAMTGIKLPFTTTALTERIGAFYNSGDSDTWPIITIEGPVLNPKVRITQSNATVWELQLKTSVGSGVSVTIDTRPWIRSVTRSDGANVAGTMRGARLAEMVVPPGWNEFVFDGQDETATATAELRFRSAWASL